jgi:hypothetical protein
MSRINRRVLFAVIMLTLLLSLSVPAAALDFDWGGAVSNTTGFDSADDGDVVQENRVSLWASGRKEFDLASLSLSGQGSYLFTDERAFLLDLDLLRFNGQFPGLLGASSVVETSLGRFPFSDPTGYILSHTADGASLRFLFPRVRLQFDGAYTGLLLNPSSDIRISGIDFSEEFDEEDNFFGPKRVFTQGQIVFTDLGRLQELVFYGLAQFDLREDDGASELVDSQYWGTLLSYRFGRNLYHDSFLTIGTSQLSGTEDSEALSLLTGFSSRYLREDWLDSRFALRGIVATPNIPIEDLDAINVSFNIAQPRPLNSPALGKVVDPNLDALIFAGMDYSLRPFLNGSSELMSRFQPSVGARFYFRPVLDIDSQTFKWTGAWAQTNPDSDSWFLGAEYDAGFVWRIFSDLSAGMSGAVFMPGDAWTSEADSEFTLRMELSASF